MYLPYIYPETSNYNYNDYNINHVFDGFLEHLLWCFEAAFPVIRVDVSGNKSKHVVNFSSSLKRKIQDLRDLKVMCRQFNTEDLEILYGIKKRELVVLVDREKEAHFSDLISKSRNKSKTVWNLVNSGKRRHHAIEIKQGDHVVCDELQIAELFRAQFSTVVESKLRDHFGGIMSSACTVAGSRVAESLFVTPVAAVDVSAIISSLPNKNSVGCDGLSTNFIKRCGDMLANTIAQFFNISVLCGQFPDSLKTALVVPVPKKGDVHDIFNYRPISLLSIVAKIFEKLMADRINSFLYIFDILGGFQHGFRRGHSTETAVVNLVQAVNNAVDGNEYVVLISFDLSRAFDTLHPEFVSEKLSRLGLRGRVNDWLLSFLRNRKSMVKINNKRSESYYTSMGTPQGSVLGPLIFLLYINDLPDHLSEGKLFAYADDITLVISDADLDGVCRRIKRVAGQFKEWCDKNRLIINSDKTVYMKFRSRLHSNFPVSITVFDKPVDFSDEFNFLGTVLDSDLTWQAHIDKVAGRLSSTCYALNSLKRNFNCETLLSIYYGMFFPHLSYCISVWGLSAHMGRLFILQKRAIRIIFNIKFRNSCVETFKNFNILTVPCIYIYKILIFIHVNKSSLELRSDVHDYCTRYSGHISLQSHRHTYYKRSPVYSGSSLYNMLPESFKNIANVRLFKVKLRQYLCSHAFYSVSGFMGRLRDGDRDFT